MPKQKLEVINSARSVRRRVKTNRYSPPHPSIPQLLPKHHVSPRRPKPTHYVDRVWTRTDFQFKTSPAKEIFKLNGTPRDQQKERNDVCRFLYHSMGNGIENETKLKDNNFYMYWNTYGRSDYSTVKTFEKKCFICYEPIKFRRGKEKTEDGECTDFCFCAVDGCPKVYHKYCLSDYYQRGNGPTDDSNNTESNTWVCPRHFCHDCDKPEYNNGTICPTCPRFYCRPCRPSEHGDSMSTDLCASCRILSKCLNAPEMSMNLRRIQ